MSAARIVRVELDRSYDLRVLAALPPTLGLFEPAALRAQLHAMTKQRRAICFTLMTPIARREADGDSEAAPGVATVLVCLHVAPALASDGLEAVLDIVAQAAETDGEPIHEFAAPVTEAPPARAGFYRESIYADADISIAITTHTPPRLPPEAMQAVATLVGDAPIDVVTTVAITPWRPGAVATLPDRTASNRTLH